ncbi:Ada metal-binding domain-containing protein [Dyadobacter sp. NIV53]|uniref:Ada metal-binding domain-containing protein n=1 Tax=Dyadobacter sp. NIV53 TaxID=2861765 RepID=UPI001C88685B|nr:Ada metal-binding domain-containing protein [Dyadobacter sp. NIV53]
MFQHTELGNSSFERKRKLKSLIDNGQVKFGGNKLLKIYGTLSCKSGKRMKIENRVFFSTEPEAVKEGYRPCGHCMREKYLAWKNNHNSYSNSKTSP